MMHRDSIISIIEKVKYQNSKKNIEIEVRFGTKLFEKKFIAKVRKIEFDNLLERLNKDHPNVGLMPVFSEEYYFSNDVRLIKDEKPLDRIENKINMTQFDIHYDVENDIYIRFNVSLEQEATLNNEKPLWYRYKERISYPINHVRIDLSKVHESDSIQGAIDSQLGYEIEIELIDLSASSETLYNELFEVVKFIHNSFFTIS